MFKSTLPLFNFQSHLILYIAFTSTSSTPTTIFPSIYPLFFSLATPSPLAISHSTPPQTCINIYTPPSLQILTSCKT